MKLCTAIFLCGWGSLFAQSPDDAPGSLTDRLTFDTTQAINEALAGYFAKPIDINVVDPSNGAMLFNCWKVTVKKRYWHNPDKSGAYILSYNCTKNQTPYLVTSSRNAKQRSPDDILIELFSSVNEPLLGGSNFVNRSRDEVVKKFGNNFIKQDEYIVYHNNKDMILLLYAPVKRITSFRLVRVHTPVRKFTDLDRSLLKTK